MGFYVYKKDILEIYYFTIEIWYDIEPQKLFNRYEIDNLVCVDFNHRENKMKNRPESDKRQRYCIKV